MDGAHVQTWTNHPNRKIPQPKLTSSLKEHILYYSSCEACEISHRTTQKVFYRGHPTPKILFIGEAPGESEDTLGVPFIGRSGDLLNRMLHEAGIPQCDYGITNTILCTPFSDSSRSLIRTPTNKEIFNCSFRLRCLINSLSPQVLVAVGAKAKGILTDLKLDHHHIVHPAYLLRQGGTSSVNYKRTMLFLKKMYAQLISQEQT